MINKFLCWVVGHKWNKLWLEDTMYEHRCDRCGRRYNYTYITSERKGIFRESPLS